MCFPWKLWEISPFKFNAIIGKYTLGFHEQKSSAVLLMLNMLNLVRYWPNSGQHGGISYSAGAWVGFPTQGLSILHKFKFKIAYL